MTSWIAVYERLRNQCPKTFRLNKKMIKIDSADKCLIYLYLIKGKSLRDITNELKDLCSVYTIRNRLLGAKVMMRGRGGHHTTNKVHLTDVDLELSGKRIAVKYNISESYAYYLLHEYKKEKGIVD